jgi:phosphatidylinositol-3-phosphatase
VDIEPHEPCVDCGSPLVCNQRYCLGCGARAGSRSPLLLALLGRLRDRSPLARAAAPRPAASAPARPPGLTLPSPRFSALLVLLFVGFGVLLGAAARSSENATLAASVRPAVRVLLAPPAPAVSSAPSSTSSSTPSSQPSLPEEAPTPSAAASPTPTTAPAKRSSGAGKAPASSGSEGGGEPAGSGPGGGASASKLPAIKHVFVIMLSGQPYASVFGPSSPAPYLSQTLEHRGALLAHYDAIAHEGLADGIALLSGQGPTVDTSMNCPTYGELAPAGTGAEHQVLGNGCVYPASTPTLPGQLTAKHLGWRAYVQSMGAGAGQPAACAHPAIGAPDLTSAATAAGAYATSINPIVYFRSLIDSPTCKARDVGLDKLKGDLARGAPSLSYIVPDRCHDGSPTPCAPGAPAGVAAADAFLKTVVPSILGSSAYRHGGLLVITVDQAPASGELADSSSCCGQLRFPNLPPSTTGVSRHGGGAVGALLLSPFVKGGTTSQEPYNHFSLLRTIEDIFGLAHLGYAGAPGVTSFEPSLFSGR